MEGMRYGGRGFRVGRYTAYSYILLSSYQKEDRHSEDAYRTVDYAFLFIFQVFFV